MFCENCGNQISDNMSFCTKCGAKVKKMDTGMSVGGQAQTGYNSQQMNQRGPVPPVMRPDSIPPQHPRQETSSYRPTPAQPSQPYGAAPGTPVHPSQSYGSSFGAPAKAIVDGDMSGVMSYGEYLITFIISAIPIVGIILLVKWAFMDKDNPNKSNFAKAFLTIALIGFVLGIIWISIFGSMMSRGFY